MAESPPIVGEAAERAGPKKPYCYSKKKKLQRYHSILRAFMTHFHGRAAPYPASHEFTEDQLRAIEPQDVVNWMKVKMFGTVAPDFSGASPITGSHHTMAFYRKGIGHFLPGGARDWDEVDKTGNPTRSNAVRNLINTVRALNDDGVATPRANTQNSKRRSGEGGFARDWDPLAKTDNPTRSKAARDLINEVSARNDDRVAAPREDKQNTKKRSSEGDGGGNLRDDKPKKRARNSAAIETPGNRNPPLPLAASARAASLEMNGLLHQIHAQKRHFLSGLEQMSAAVARMKSEVESSYNTLASRIVAAQPPALVAGDPARTDEPPRLPRSRNLFAIWSVREGRLTPLGEDWTFPSEFTVHEILNGWFLGEPATNMPPMQYLTAGHMKHIKGAADSLNKVRRFMKIVKYLGLKAGYWAENWDIGRIDALWTRIFPGMETHLGRISAEERSGDTSWREMANALSKNEGVLREMAANPQLLADESAASYAVKATEDASLGALASNEGGEMKVVNMEGAETEDAGTEGRAHELELLWGIHHGKLNPLPADWQFPTQFSILQALNLWLLGDPRRKIPPFRYIHSSYVAHLKSGVSYLSKLRCVMKVIKHYGSKLDCWHEEDDWDQENITTLWYTVRDDLDERIKIKLYQGRSGVVTWQSVYNKMHDKGVIKELNADKDKEAADKDISEDA